jgi:hypothetical protein
MVAVDVKRAAAERWATAVSAEGSYGQWRYVLAKKTTEVTDLISKTAQAPRIRTSLNVRDLSK